MRQPGKQPLFPLGRILGTPSALAVLEKAGQSPEEFLVRHVCGDWGHLSEHDRNENQFSLERGLRLLSRYRTCSGEEICIMTEADRSVTTILLPEE
jgi:hypothetical protein